MQKWLPEILNRLRNGDITASRSWIPRGTTVALSTVQNLVMLRQMNDHWSHHPPLLFKGLHSTMTEVCCSWPQDYWVFLHFLRGMFFYNFLPFSKSPLLTLEAADITFSLCSHVASPLCTCAHGVSYSSYKDTSLNLNYLFKYLISKYSHIGS